MKNKQNRLAAIRIIISNEKVGSQEQLQKILNEKGFDITQATLSRDLKQLKIAKKLKEKGYNPLDYKLDVEEITLKLKQMKATREYSLLQKFSQIYETGRGCPEAIRQVYNDALRRCSESQETIPTYKRIFKRKVNPFTAEIERTKATLEELAHKLSKCVLVKERAGFVNKALKTIMK